MENKKALNISLKYFNYILNTLALSTSCGSHTAATTVISHSYYRISVTGSPYTTGSGKTGSNLKWKVRVTIYIGLMSMGLYLVIFILTDRLL